MKVFVTKYALTKGIKEVEVELCRNSMVKGPNAFEYYHGEGREWHRDYSKAFDKAELMRTKEIARMEKKIEKLKALKF